jgi:8-oxo-dGTP pyrophosphatase MutT (NUDIX family)
MNSTPVHGYRAAGGVVVADSGEQILTLKRPGRLAPDGRPEIRLPKGHVEPDETPTQTALREVSEESGVSQPRILSRLGEQTVQFEWNGVDVIREEVYFLMAIEAGTGLHEPEKQYERLWLTWQDALTELSFEAEREWLRRARVAWQRRL